MTFIGYKRTDKHTNTQPRNVYIQWSGEIKQVYAYLAQVDSNLDHVDANLDQVDADLRLNWVFAKSDLADTNLGKNNEI